MNGCDNKSARTPEVANLKKLSVMKQLGKQQVISSERDQLLLETRKMEMSQRQREKIALTLNSTEYNNVTIQLLLKKYTCR